MGSLRSIRHVGHEIRQLLKQIPYSVKEIYEIKTSGQYHSLVPIYKHTPYEMAPDYIITEDGKLVYKKIKEHWKKFSQSINVLMEEE